MTSGAFSLRILCAALSASLFGIFHTSTDLQAALQQSGGQKPVQGRVFEGHSNQVDTVAFSPDGSRALSGGQDGFLILWDLKTGHEVHRFGGKQAGLITGVAFSPDGRSAVSGLSGQQPCCALILWEVDSGRVIRRLEGHQGFASQVLFSPDGRLIVSASADKTIRIWNVDTGVEIRRLVGHEGLVKALAVSKDGR